MDVALGTRLVLLGDGWSFPMWTIPWFSDHCVLEFFLANWRNLGAKLIFYRKIEITTFPTLERTLMLLYPRFLGFPGASSFGGVTLLIIRRLFIWIPLLSGFFLSLECPAALFNSIGLSMDFMQQWKESWRLSCASWVPGKHSCDFGPSGLFLWEWLPHLRPGFLASQVAQCKPHCRQTLEVASLHHPIFRAPRAA